MCFMWLTLGRAGSLPPGAALSLLRAALPLVGPRVGHGDGGVGVAARQRRGQHASRERGQRVGGQQEGARGRGVGGEGEGALHAGVPGQHASLGCHCETDGVDTCQ